MPEGKILSEFAPLETLKNIFLKAYGHTLSRNDVEEMIPFIKSARDSVIRISQFMMEHLYCDDEREQRLINLIYKKCCSYKTSFTGISFSGEYISGEPINYQIENIVSHLQNIIQNYSDINETSENDSLNSGTNKTVDSNNGQQGKSFEELEKKLKEYEELAEVASKNIPYHDKVRLELALRLMEEAGCNLEKYGNKAQAARMLETITTLPSSTCSNYVTNRDLNTDTHKDEVLEINSKLQSLGINIIL